MVYLSLGSNMGDSMRVLEKAVKELSTFFQNPKWSAVYRTEAMYDTQQNDFLNLCFCGESQKNTLDIQRALQNLEKEMGRQRDPDRPKGPRVIDIDFLQRNQEILNLPELILPHPGILERPFVLVPLLELNSDLQDPHSGQPYRLTLERLDCSGVYFLGEIA